MPFGMGPMGWFVSLYGTPYWETGRCKWFPWLPRWWWTGMYGSMSPFTPYPSMLTFPKEQELAVLEDQVNMLEQELEQIRKRIGELKSE